MRPWRRCWARSTARACGALLQALAAGDGSALMGEAAALAEFSPDWASVLDALGEALHRVQVRQLVPDVAVEGEGVDVDALARQLRPEVVQLWYQMALHGRRDLPLAPSPRSGFEMCLLRMLAFRPAGSGDVAPGTDQASGRGTTAATAAAAKSEVTAVPVASAARVDGDEGDARSADAMPPTGSAPEASTALRLESEPASPPAVAPAAGTPSTPDHPQASAPYPDAPARAPSMASAITPHDGAARLSGLDDWHALLDRGAFKGPAKLLAEHAGFLGHDDGTLRLSLPESDEHLRTALAVRMLGDALAAALGAPQQVRFEVAAGVVESARERNERVRDERQTRAEADFMADPDVRRLIAQHGARVVPDSIRPFDGA